MIGIFQAECGGVGSGRTDPDVPPTTMIFLPISLSADFTILINVLFLYCIANFDKIDSGK